MLRPSLALSSVLVLATFAACEDTTDVDIPPRSDAGGGDVTTGDAVVGDAAPPPPTPAAFGLDTRPANTTCVAPKRPTLTSGVKFVDAFPGITFNAPMKIVQAPGDPAHFYVLERGFLTGSTSENVTTKVRRFPLNIATPSQFEDFATVTVDPLGEGGLLGIAFHPQWQTNHTVFLSYTRKWDGSKDPDPDTFNPKEPNSDIVSVVSKWTSTDNGVTVSNPVEIFTRVQPYSNHNGGDLAFSPIDHFLYFGLGDGGSGDDPLNSGQTLSSALGKILRFDVDSASPYAIPPSNPFASGAGGALKEIFAYGFRNPFRWNFDRATGDLWVGDVGQNTFEEIDRVEIGGNYGWKTCEGFHKRGDDTALCNTPGLKNPVVEHGRSEANSITGGAVYRGKAMPSLVGTYVYGDYAQGNIWGLFDDATGKKVPRLLGKVSNVVNFAEDADGEIYLVQLTGKIMKMVVDASAPPPDAFPEKLSKTGCVLPSDPKKPAAGVIPFGVRSPLWSDGAQKDRWLALPDGKVITVGADGDFQFPIGTVLMKSFAYDGKLHETRLFMLHEDGVWAGYSYEWDDAQTDATLLPAGKTRDLGAGRLWSYPSRSQCLQCHTAAAGGSLGLELGQLNGEYVYPATNRLSNQLATLDHIGMFDKPLGDVNAAPRYPEPFGTADPIESRARAYLHSNCSFCHRPSGGGGGTIDLRFTPSLATTNTCGKPPLAGNFGPADSKIIFAGDPTKSMLSIRVHATDAKRMPPVGVREPDPQGTKLLDDWITSLTTCPP